MSGRPRERTDTKANVEDLPPTRHRQAAVVAQCIAIRREDTAVHRHRHRHHLLDRPVAVGTEEENETMTP